MSIAAEKSTSQLYVAMFGRAPDAEGFTYWAGLLDDGASPAQVADAMFGTAPAREFFPEGLGNAAIVAAFYSNVLGREADAEGLAFWTAKLDAAAATPGSVIAELIQAIAGYGGNDPEGVASAVLFNTRVESAFFYGRYANASPQDSTVRFRNVEPLDVDVRTLTLPDGTQGVINAAGYEHVSIGRVGGVLQLTGLADGAALVFRQSSANWFDGDLQSSIWCELADSSGTDNSLRVHIASAVPASVGNLFLSGVEFLDVSGTLDEGFGHEVYLGSSHIQQVSIGGNAPIGLFNGTIGTVDTTGFGQRLYTELDGLALLLGGVGLDAATATASGSLLYGGPGPDRLSSIFGSEMTAYGGAGSDVFYLFAEEGTSSTQVTLGDFTPGEDKISIQDLVGSLHGGGVLWNSSALRLDSARSLEECLDAATSRTTSPNSATVSWFQWQEETFIVVDRSTAAGFVDGSDHFITLLGAPDLSSLRIMYVDMFFNYVLA